MNTPRHTTVIIVVLLTANLLALTPAFAQADAGQARRTGHLTARACGEIAQAAGVGQLLAFHLSRRYQEEPELVYDEIREVCTCLASPPVA